MGKKSQGDAASKANGLSSRGNVEQHLGHDDSLRTKFLSRTDSGGRSTYGSTSGCQQGQADDGQVSETVTR